MVWSLPPKTIPIAGRLIAISSRIRYMATWRGKTMCLSLRLLTISLTEIP